MNKIFFWLLFLFTAIHAAAQVPDEAVKDRYKALEKTVPDFIGEMGNIYGSRGLVLFEVLYVDTLNKDEIKDKGPYGILYKFSEEDPEYEGVDRERTANSMWVFPKIIKDTLLLGLRSAFHTTGIQHILCRGDVETKYTETYRKNKLFKLNRTDTLAWQIHVPVTVTAFELSTWDFIPDQTVYGYCELETAPYYQLIDMSGSVILNIRKRMKYYFSFIIRPEE